MKPYEMLLQKSKEIGWPKHYSTDLTVHDRNFLEKNKIIRPFLWAIRECGTWIIIPEAEGNIGKAVCIQSINEHNNQLFFIVNPLEQTMKEIDAVSAHNWLEEEYEHQSKKGNYNIVRTDILFLSKKSSSYSFYERISISAENHKTVIEIYLKDKAEWIPLNEYLSRNEDRYSYDSINCPDGSIISLGKITESQRHNYETVSV